MELTNAFYEENLVYLFQITNSIKQRLSYGPLLCIKIQLILVPKIKYLLVHATNHITVTPLHIKKWLLIVVTIALLQYQKYQLGVFQKYIATKPYEFSSAWQRSVKKLHALYLSRMRPLDLPIAPNK